MTKIGTNAKVLITEIIPVLIKLLALQSFNNE